VKGKFARVLFQLNAQRSQVANGANRFGRGGIWIDNGSSRRETGEAGRMSADGFSHLIVVASDEVGHRPATALSLGLNVRPRDRRQYLAVIVVGIHHLEPVFEIVQSAVGEEKRAGTGSIAPQFL